MVPFFLAVVPAVSAAVSAAVTEEVMRVKASSVELVHVMSGLHQERRSGNCPDVSAVSAAVSESATEAAAAAESSSESATISPISASHDGTDEKASEEGGHLKNVIVRRMTR